MELARELIVMVVAGVLIGCTAFYSLSPWKCEAKYSDVCK